MSQGVTRKKFTVGSLRGHEDARTVLLRMALDHGRAERIHDQKQQHPELTWREIADKIGVSERSALDWQATGGISHANCKKLAQVFGVDPDWLWSGTDHGTGDLMGALSAAGAGPGQLDRIEAKLDQLLGLLSGAEPADLTEQLTRHFEELAAKHAASSPTAPAAAPPADSNKESAQSRPPRKRRSA